MTATDNTAQTTDEALKLGDRPLVVCDVDEVVLQFIAPFSAFLEAHDLQLNLRSFSLNGNVRSLISGEYVPDAVVEASLTAFYDEQEEWQVPFDEALAILTQLRAIADVLLLTAMPPQHQSKRERLLRRFGFDFPLIASEAPKGEVLATLLASDPPATIFVDDMNYNCRSVAQKLPEALSINLLIDDHYRKIAPPTEPPSVRAAGWHEADRLIRRHIAEKI